jgi:hypothetical protein
LPGQRVRNLYTDFGHDNKRHPLSIEDSFRNWWIQGLAPQAAETNQLRIPSLTPSQLNLPTLN